MKKKKLKETHHWFEEIEVECPYCNQWLSYPCDCYGEGDKLACTECTEVFILGEQK